MGQTSTVGSHRTTVASHNGRTCVTYHRTIVVSWNHETIQLDSGGWQTFTTKTRMNQAANQYDLGFGVYQKDFDWFVTLKIDGEWRHDDEPIVFRDGMTIDRETLEISY